MSSVGDIREALTVAIERTDEARGHARLAHSRLEETARLYSGLAESTDGLPRGDVDRARRDLDEAMGILGVASETLSDLAARL